jgi:hypothetical protein
MSRSHGSEPIDIGIAANCETLLIENNTMVMKEAPPQTMLRKIIRLIVEGNAIFSSLSLFSSLFDDDLRI